jgi:flagellin-like protein
MMAIMGKRFTNRGVSTIIAALLLIAIAIAAGVLLYVFSMGLMGTLQGSGGQEVKDEVIMEAYDWHLPASLVLQLRNTGATTVNLNTADLYLAGQGPVTAGSGGAVGTCTTGSANTAVIPGGACPYTITISNPNSYTVGVAYVIKLALADGGVFSYSAVNGGRA